MFSQCEQRCRPPSPAAPSAESEEQPGSYAGAFLAVLRARLTVFLAAFFFVVRLPRLVDAADLRGALERLVFVAVSAGGAMFT